jgi:peptidoglycan/xylan/chitin deacetylase (PgdA/CDA1 family)
MGLSIIQWNIDSLDYIHLNDVLGQPEIFVNIANSIYNSNPKTDSFIIIQFDFMDFSVAYIPKIIEMIAAKGYTFVTIEQCLGGKIPAYAKNAKGTAAAPAQAPAPAPAQ